MEDLITDNEPKHFIVIITNLGRVDASLGYSGLVALVLDLVQQGAYLVELCVTRCRTALLNRVRWRTRFRELILSS